MRRLTVRRRSRPAVHWSPTVPRSGCKARSDSIRSTNSTSRATSRWSQLTTRTRICRHSLRVTQTSRATASGKTCRATGTLGLRTTRAKRISHPIRTVSGCGSPDPATRGLTMRRTATRRLTTARGSTTQTMAGGSGNLRLIKIRTRQQASRPRGCRLSFPSS